MEPSHDLFHHPYDPYDIQLDFMSKLYRCIEQRHIGLFESPTGTGKSLSLICAALSWLRDDERRRLYGDAYENKELDWLEKAEKESQRRQLLEARRELEEKLSRIQRQRLMQGGNARPSKKLKADDQLDEQDLILADYESDQDQISKKDKDSTLSTATVALLQKLQPVSTHTDCEDDEARPKVIFCSRTHSQLTQFVNELRKLSIPSGASESKDEQEIVKHVSLGSRKNLCIHPQVSRLTSTTAINERCLELQNPGASEQQRCQFFPKRTSIEDKTRLDEFKHHALAQIQDIEDLASLGRQMKMCPYYASRTVISSAEVLTLPYPLLVQKNAREALGVDVKDNVVIVDEAHNLISAIADTLSVSMPLSHLQLAHKQLVGYCQKFKNLLKGKNRVYIAQIIKLLKSCISRLDAAATRGKGDTSLLANELIAESGGDQIHPHKLMHYIQQSKLIFKVEGYAEIVNRQAQSQIVRDVASDVPRSQVKGVLAEFQKLLMALMNPDTEGRFFITNDEQEVVLKYSLLDPQAHFEPIVREARAVILAGGTMSPMGDWHDQLFAYVDHDRIKTYTFGHIISANNVVVEPLSKGPNGVDFDFTFNNRRSQEMVMELAAVIESLCRVAPDGMVVFFPSYDYLAFVSNIWKRQEGRASHLDRISAHKEIFQETKASDADELLRNYGNAINIGKGAILLAVVGGKLSEGINFSDKLGRVVLCVGLPYPNVNSAEWKAKIEYIGNKAYLRARKADLPESECKARAQISAREYADNTTMRAVNQSIGRAIRHKNDYAAIFLVDKRYSTPRIQSRLPAWLEKSVRSGPSEWSLIVQGCDRFFKSKAS